MIDAIAFPWLSLSVQVILTFDPANAPAHSLLFLCTYYFGYFVLFAVSVYFPCLVFIPGMYLIALIILNTEIKSRRSNRTESMCSIRTDCNFIA